MLLNPRFLSIVLAVLVTSITVSFLWFLPEITMPVLFVAGVSSFFATLGFVYYVLDYLIFQQLDKIYETIERLKVKNLDISKKKLSKNANPLKKLNNDLYVYVAKKQREVEELKRLEQFRREFLADVSHELKTPIFAAQGFVHTLLDGAMNDENVREKFLAKAAKSLDGLDALVHDLVTLSQMETGDIRMRSERVDVIELVYEIFEQLEKKATERTISLHLKYPNNQEVIIKADQQRIRQVLSNLIENAIKYGKEKGSVTVMIEDHKKEWLILVKDNGLGIAPQHLDRIFERFYRVEKSRSRDMGGTGLGLAIVKHIVNAHKSKISVASKLHEGTIFSFKLNKATDNKP